jgi:hypothetical protein
MMLYETGNVRVVFEYKYGLAQPCLPHAVLFAVYKTAADPPARMPQA